MKKFLFFLILMANSAPASAEPIIRIALLKNISAVTIEGNELHIRTPEEKPAAYAVGSPLKIVPTAGGFKTEEEIYREPYLKVLSSENRLLVNGKRFEGNLEIRRTPENNLTVLNEVPLEKYLIGLIHGEINANWPKEAIKAQAVAARTYALYRKGDVPLSYTGQITRGNVPYDLEATTADQVYAGSLGKKDFLAEEAIAETKGEVLWFLGFFPAYFHSCCGGETETADHVWGKKESSKSVVDPYCKNAPYYRWELSLTTREFFQKLKKQGLEGSHLRSIQLEHHADSDRNAVAAIETDKMTFFINANDLRRILGYENLKSTRFEASLSPRWITFKGGGYGHGVGLCQWGAKAMAEAGKNYREILEFYYPKAAVRKVY